MMIFQNPTENLQCLKVFQETSNCKMTVLQRFRVIYSDNFVSSLDFHGLSRISWILLQVGKPLTLKQQVSTTAPTSNTAPLAESRALNIMAVVKLGGSGKLVSRITLT
jgi:hypothetical protein